MTTTTIRRRLALLAVLAGAGIAVAGCGTQTLDTDKAETEIQKGIEAQTQVKATVACPDDVEIKAKDTFECTATPEDGGEKGTVTVTQKDDEGNITWELK